MDWYQKSAACVGWTYDETAPPRVLTCSGRRSSDWDDLRWVDRVSSIFDDADGGVNNSVIEGVARAEVTASYSGAMDLIQRYGVMPRSARGRLPA